MKNLFLFFLLLLMSWNAHALKQEDLLHPDQAFQFSAETLNDQTVRLTWDIADGYYLYKNRFDFNSETQGINLVKADAIYPEGELKIDPNFGEVIIYHNAVSLDIPIERASSEATEFKLKAKFLGCAEAGLCYPPQRKTATLQLAALAGETLPTTTSSEISAETKQVTEDISPKPLFGNIGSNIPLPVDEAFRFSLTGIDKNTLNARWEIAPEHHLYRSKIKFSANTEEEKDLSLEQIDFPEAKVVDDEFFGKMEIYDQGIDAQIQLPESIAGGKLAVNAHYQGCSIATGICYPIVSKLINLDLAELPDHVSTKTSSNSTSAGTQLTDEFFSGSFIGILAAFFVIGLGLSLTPCIFPMIPILSGIIAGQSNLSAYKAFTLSLTYVLASASAYALIGLVFGFFGSNLQSSLQHPIAIALFATLFVTLAFSMFGFFELQMPVSIQSRLNEISNKQRSGSLIGAAIMGFLSTLIVGPCVAPALAAALTYIANSKDALLGASALFSMGFGMGVILLIVGTLGGHLLPRAGSWMDTTKAIFGIMLMGMAIWMLDRIVPIGITMLLSGILLVSSGIYMGALDKLSEESGGWSRFWKSIGLILLFFGATQLFGVAGGSQNILQPLKGLLTINVSSNGAITGIGNPSTTNQSDKLPFEMIKGSADLEKALLKAQAADQRTMLDFYADWCIDCKRMEKNVFSTPEVRNALNNVLLLKADVTAQDSFDVELQQRFGIVGPPTIIFFDRNGQEVSSLRMIGYENVPTFTQRLGDFAAIDQNQ